MDYKYIEQLLDSYWEGQTSLAEEDILRTFFSQKDVPAHLMKYQALFVYTQEEVEKDVLDNQFDDKILSIIGEEPPVKARTITMAQRLMPLFKAAAVVAIILSLSNALQMSFDYKNSNSNAVDPIETTHQSGTVAISDSTTLDSMKQSTMLPAESVPVTIIK